LAEAELHLVEAPVDGAAFEFVEAGEFVDAGGVVWGAAGFRGIGCFGEPTK
jgi:hypothetical protein